MAVNGRKKNVTPYISSEQMECTEPIDAKYEAWAQSVEFATVCTQHQSNDRLLTFYAIILRKKESKIPLRFTIFADMCVSPIETNHSSAISPEKCYAVTQFLNFVFFHSYEQYKITNIANVTTDMVKDYIEYYAATLTTSGNYPSIQSVSNKRDAICIFLYNLIKADPKRFKYLKKEWLLTVIAVERKLGQGTRMICRFMIPARSLAETEGELLQIDRDIPMHLKDRFLQMAETYDPGITFAIALQIYAGLREGEVCNVRGIDSIYGPGIVIGLMRDGGRTRCDSIQLDLRHEYALRDDGKSVGRIKKERIQSVYGPYTDILYRYYVMHCKYLDAYKNDINIQAPMFVNKAKVNGLYTAMTVSGYRRRIKTLFWKRVIPSCKDDPDPELRRYWVRMQNKTFGAHAFRHLFTVSLVLAGVDNVAMLMNLRGDKSPLSSITYLKEKGVLLNKYKAAAEKIGLAITGERRN